MATKKSSTAPNSTIPTNFRRMVAEQRAANPELFGFEGKPDNEVCRILLGNAERERRLKLESESERPIIEAKNISDQITRQLTQLRGICTLIGAADMTREIFDNDDLQAAMWGVQDLVQSIENDYREFYAIARKEMTKEVAHG